MRDLCYKDFARSMCNDVTMISLEREGTTTGRDKELDCWGSRPESWSTPDHHKPLSEQVYQELMRDAAARGALGNKVCTH